MAESPTGPWLRPRYVFAALLVLLVLAVVIAPDTGDQDIETARLTTKERQAFNASGIHDVLQRLGIHVEQRLTPLRAPLDSAAVYAVLLPPIEPSARETAALLDAVRRGAGLITLPRIHTPLADSLGIERSEYSIFAMRATSDSLYGEQRTDSAGDSVATGRDAAGRDTLGDRERLNRFLAFDPTENARAFHHFLQPPVKSDSDSTRVFPGGVVTLLSARRNAAKPVVMGRTLGRGRVLLLADGDFLRNASLRRGDGAVLAVRLIEWVDPDRAMPVVFDEYGQGYGEHRDLVGTVIHGLASTAAGRATLQVALAALILILAAAVRPIAPQQRTIIERRSPLEHVSALSRAYERIGATRLATRRMVRGLRRRHPMGATGVIDDDAYLALIQSRAAAVREDVDLLRRAMRDPLPAAEFVRAGAAIDHIERTLTS